MMTEKQFNGRIAEILLVEDKPADVRLTREALKDANIRLNLNHVSDGYEALEYLRNEGQYSNAVRPDLILLDLNMPRMNGREFLAKVKEDSALRQIPVAAFTFSNAEEDIRASYDLQASCYVTKPLDFTQMGVIVREIERFYFQVVCLPT